MMANGAGNEVVAVGIRTVDQKLGHAIAHGGALDVLAQGPPTVVVHLAEILLRTVEEGDVLAHPFRRLCVGDSGDDVLVFHRVETLGIVGEIVVTENGSDVVIYGTADDVGDMIAHRWVKFIGTGHVEVLVGGRVEVGLVEGHACAEDDA